MTYKEFKDRVDKFRSGDRPVLAFINPNTELSLVMDLIKIKAIKDFKDHYLYGVLVLRSDVPNLVLYQGPYNGKIAQVTQC